MADDDYDGAPELQESDDEEEEVRVVQSKWLNDDGKHVLKHEHAGTYTPKGLIRASLWPPPSVQEGW